MKRGRELKGREGKVTEIEKTHAERGCYSARPLLRENNNCILNSVLSCRLELQNFRITSTGRMRVWLGGEPAWTEETRSQWWALSAAFPRCAPFWIFSRALWISRQCKVTRRQGEHPEMKVRLAYTHTNLGGLAARPTPSR